MYRRHWIIRFGPIDCSRLKTVFSFKKGNYIFRKNSRIGFKKHKYLYVLLKCSTSQPHFCSENNPATIEEDKILLALQQLASNSNCANFNKNIKRISKLPKVLTRTMPLFDGKPTGKPWIVWRSVPKMSENSKPTHGRRQNTLILASHAYWCFADVQEHQQLQEREFAEILTVFRWKYVKPESMATAKPKT